MTDHDQEENTIQRPKRWSLFRFLRVTAILLLILLSAHFLIGQLYHGPKTLRDVVAVMPGVPIFPLAEMSPSNRKAQRALALPIVFMHLQGVRRIEAAQLQAPADDSFIIYWYQRLAPTQGWRYVGQKKDGSTTRALFLRRDEGLQVIVKQSRDIFTPVQLMYLDGVSAEQVAELTDAVPHQPEPIQTKPTVPTNNPINNKPQPSDIKPPAAENPSLAPTPNTQQPPATAPELRQPSPPEQQPTPSIAQPTNPIQHTHAVPRSHHTRHYVPRHKSRPHTTVSAERSQRRRTYQPVSSPRQHRHVHRHTAPVHPKAAKSPEQPIYQKRDIDVNQKTHPLPEKPATP